MAAVQTRISPRQLRALGPLCPPTQPRGRLHGRCAQPLALPHTHTLQPAAPGGSSPGSLLRRAARGRGRGAKRAAGLQTTFLETARLCTGQKSKKKGGFRQIVGPRLTGRPLSTPSNRLCFPRRLPLCLNIESKIKTCFVLHCLRPGGERGCVCLLHVQQHRVGGSNQVQGAFIRNIFFSTR